MKSKKLNKKLTLGKNTVATLDHKEQGHLKGGYYYTRMYGGAECYTWHPQCYTKPDYVCSIPACPYPDQD